MTYQFDFKDLKITVSQIENVLGYTEGDDRTFVMDLIDELLIESQKICSVKAQYSVFNDVSFDKNSRSVNIEGISFDIKKIVFGQIKKSDSAALFLCTAGDEIGIRSRKAMQDRDFLKGYIYDVIGSEVVESAADLMQDKLEQAAASEGLKITNRYSPGYCGWMVSEQKKLFNLLPPGFCGISLSDSCLMQPIKSISGFIGIGPEIHHKAYTCEVCESSQCLYRNLKHKV